MSRSTAILGVSANIDNIFSESVDIYFSSWSITFSDRDNISFIEKYQVQEEGENNSTTLPLPDPEVFFQESFSLAFPQVLAWSSAATGILLVVLLIKSFTK